MVSVSRRSYVAPISYVFIRMSTWLRPGPERIVSFLTQPPSDVSNQDSTRRSTGKAATLFRYYLGMSMY